MMQTIIGSVFFANMSFPQEQLIYIYMYIIIEKGGWT